LNCGEDFDRPTKRRGTRGRWGIDENEAEGEEGAKLEEEEELDETKGGDDEGDTLGDEEPKYELPEGIAMD
jgi:hypothetical protein